MARYVPLRSYLIMMKKIFLLVSILFSCMLIAQAQNRKNSSLTKYDSKGSGTRVKCASEVLDDSYEDWLQPLIEAQRIKNEQEGVTSVVYTIPVVFHVIHTGTNPGVSYNISNAQLLSQIAVLNEDFRRLNADTSNTPAVFKPSAADCEVNFCLAQTDPNGNPTTGIDRINRSTMGWSAPPYTKTYVDATIKPATIWNTNNYLNIWVTPDINVSGFPVLGYATFPAGSGLSGLTSGFGTATSDGVVLWYKAVGRVGLLDPSYNKGRTATHEIGHWLGLRHIWGDQTCGNDFCSDTPTQSGDNFGCPNFPSLSSGSCANGPNGDQFMNYMDYCDDICLNMFTAQQKLRIQTVLQNAPMRIAQRNSTACNAPAPIPVAAFTANTTSITAGDSVSFTDQSSAAPTSWSWSFPGASPSVSSVQNPSGIVYSTAGTYPVTLIVNNANGGDTLTKSAYIVVSPAASSPCDTVSNYDLSSHNPTIFLSPGSGYVSGQNFFGDVAKADKFAVPGIAQIIDGVFIGFGLGTSSGTGQTCSVKVWDDNGTGGFPSTELASVSLSYDTISAHVSAGELTWIDFSPGIPVATGSVYVGVEFGYNPGDTLAVLHCDDGEIAQGTAYEKWDTGTWYAYNDTVNAWGIEVAHLIIPVFCTVTGNTESSTHGKTYVFPNPTRDVLHVVIPDAGRDEPVFTVRNILGAAVSTPAVSHVNDGMYNVDIRELSTGFYLLEVIDRGNYRVVRFEVSR